MQKLRHKFGAIRTERNTFRFGSKLEADYYDQLCLLKKGGVVLFFLRQVPFHLPGNIIYRADFQVFYKDGLVEFVDVKGFETKEFKLKKKLVECHYPIKIKLIKKDDIRRRN